MAGERVLEVEQAERVAAGKDHQIVRMVVAKDQYGFRFDLGQNAGPSLPPGGKEARLVDLDPQRRRIPFGEIGRASCRERVVSVRVDPGGRRIIQKKTEKTTT